MPEAKSPDPPTSPPSTAPLSILQVIAPGPFGGAESVVYALVAGLAGRGHEVYAALTLEKAGAESPLALRLGRAGARGVTTLRLPSRAYLKERRELLNLIETIGPDVVHTHGYRSDVIGGLAARAAGVPVLSTAHGTTGGGAKNRFYEWLQRMAYRRFDAVVAVSAPLARALKGSAAAPPVHTVPNAWWSHGAARSRQDARAALSLPDEAFVVGWVGRMSREKGVDVLVDAAERLADLEIEFCFLGDGPERARLMSRTRESGLAARWAGAVSDASRLFPAFDLFVLSSRTEGTPIVIFEAMEAGVPIIASRVGGVPDILTEEIAWLVPADDPFALAAAVREAHLDEAGRRRRAREARRALSSRHGPEPWIQRYEELYAQLARPEGG